MIEYHKIETLLNRSKDTFKVTEGEWRLPEFEYLKDCQWEFTEKVDGTNIRIGWNGLQHKYGGRTDNAQMPTFLLSKLENLFPPAKLAEVFNTNYACLYGEGYGAKIQKGGGNYISDGVDFILFDVKIGEWWLKREDVKDIAKKLDIKVVPIVGIGTLHEAISKASVGFESYWSNVNAEGLVVRPMIELMTRAGNRIIGKIKQKDF